MHAAHNGDGNEANLIMVFVGLINERQTNRIEYNKRPYDCPQCNWQQSVQCYIVDEIVNGLFLPKAVGHFESAVSDDSIESGNYSFLFLFFHNFRLHKMRDDFSSRRWQWKWPSPLAHSQNPNSDRAARYGMPNWKWTSIKNTTCAFVTVAVISDVESLLCCQNDALYSIAWLLKASNNWRWRYYSVRPPMGMTEKWNSPWLQCHSKLFTFIFRWKFHGNTIFVRVNNEIIRSPSNSTENRREVGPSSQLA